MIFVLNARISAFASARETKISVRNSFLIRSSEDLISPLNSFFVRSSEDLISPLNSFFFVFLNVLFFLLFIIFLFLLLHQFRDSLCLKLLLNHLYLTYSISIASLCENSRRENLAT